MRFISLDEMDFMWEDVRSSFRLKRGNVELVLLFSRRNVTTRAAFIYMKKIMQFS